MNFKKLLSIFSYHSEWTTETIRDWQKKRSKGPLMFILEFGIMKWGFFMLSIFSAYHYVIVGHEFSVTEFLIDGLIWVSAGAILGICLWRTTDCYFAKYSKSGS